MQIFYQGDKRVMTFNEYELKQYEKLAIYIPGNLTTSSPNYSNFELIHSLPNSYVEFYLQFFSIQCIKNLAMIYYDLQNEIELKVPNKYKINVYDCLYNGNVFELYIQSLEKSKTLFIAFPLIIQQEISLISYYKFLINFIKNFKNTVLYV